MSRERQVLGKWGEDAAANYLVAKGFIILERNIHTPYGELDIIAHKPAATPLEGCMLVFVEVKTRGTRSLGFPEESVNFRKKAHLTSSAQYYVQNHPERTEDWRIDVISILRLHPGQPPEITHFENAIIE